MHQSAALRYAFGHGLRQTESERTPALFGRAPFQDGFGAGPDVEFFVNVLQVPADGAMPDAETVGDLLIRITLSHQFQNLALAG